MTRVRLLSIGELERRGAILAIQDGNHGEKHPVEKDYVEQGIPFLMASDIKDGSVDLVNCKFISKEQADSLRIGFARRGDVLLTHKGTVGSVAILPEVENYVMLTPQVTYYRVNDQMLSNRYLRYAFEEPVFQSRLSARSVQSTRPYIGITAQRELEVVWHERAEQEKIVSIISAYDDMIENSNRRIKILEEMAQMVYQEWFVNFRFPGHEEVRMVGSEFGLIPEGWQFRTISDLYQTSSGGTPRRDSPEFYGGTVDWVKTRELHDSFIFDSEERITDLGLRSSSAKIFQQNTVLMAMYGATIGQLGILSKPSACNQACCALFEKKDNFGYEFLFLTLKHKRNDIIGLRMGAAQQNINQEVIRQISIIQPSPETMRLFKRTISPVFDKISVLQRKNLNLNKTRGLLLPKLISGEISVEHLEAETTSQVS